MARLGLMTLMNRHRRARNLRLHMPMAALGEIEPPAHSGGNGRFESTPPLAPMRR